MDKDNSNVLVEQVRKAYHAGNPLRITGAGSKDFLGYAVDAEELNVSSHCGIIDFDKQTGTVWLRAGTSLTALNRFLAVENYYLAFDPPQFAQNSSVGGMVASGFSGSARPFVGAVMDHVLACRVINGEGQELLFSDYDPRAQAGTAMAQMMVGTMGCFGVLLDIQLRCQVKPETELTLALPAAYNEAFDIMNARASQSLPWRGIAYDGDCVLQRLAGEETTLRQLKRRLAGDELQHSQQLWDEINHQQHFFFRQHAPLWRLSLSSSILPIGVPGYWFLDWNGGLRWLASFEPEQHIRDAVEQEGGHATLFRAPQNYPFQARFHPMSAPQSSRYRQLKQLFDPGGILNIGRMYRGI